MTAIDWEKCISLANKRLRDIITAANNADAKEMTSLMLSSMCSKESEFTKQAELTLSGDCKEGIYFDFQGYNFHITKDSEFNSKYHPNMYHIWFTCFYFDGEEVPMSLVHVGWIYGASFLEEKHKAFLDGEITKQELEQYLKNDVNTCCSYWLEKNREKIDK